MQSRGHSPSLRGVTAAGGTGIVTVPFWCAVLASVALLWPRYFQCGSERGKLMAAARRGPHSYSDGCVSYCAGPSSDAVVLTVSEQFRKGRWSKTACFHIRGCLETFRTSVTVLDRKRLQGWVKWAHYMRTSVIAPCSWALKIAEPGRSSVKRGSLLPPCHIHQRVLARGTARTEKAGALAQEQRTQRNAPREERP